MIRAACLRSLTKIKLDLDPDIYPHAMPSTMPLPVALLIAPHLSPYELLQAARVNRAWYESFMSDAVWQEWDVYGIERNIARHYLSLKFDVTPDQWCKFDALPQAGYLGFNWYRFLAIGKNNLQARTESWLSYLTKAPIPLLEAMAKWPYWQGVSFLNVRASDQEDKQLVYGLLEAGLKPLGLNAIYKTDVTAAASTKNWIVENYFNRTLLEHFDCALKLVQDSPLNYAKLGEKLKQDKEIFKAHIDCHMSYWRNSKYEEESSLKSHQSHQLDINPLISVPASIKQDKLLMLELVKKLPACYASLADSLKLDQDIAIAVLSSFGPHCDYCKTGLDVNLYKDKDFVVKAISLPKAPVLRLEELPRDILFDVDVIRAVLEHYQKSLMALSRSSYKSGPKTNMITAEKVVIQFVTRTISPSRILTLIAFIDKSLDNHSDWTYKAEQVQFTLQHCLVTLPEVDELHKLRVQTLPVPQEPQEPQPTPPDALFGLPVDNRAGADARVVRHTHVDVNPLLPVIDRTGAGARVVRHTHHSRQRVYIDTNPFYHTEA